MSFFIDSEKDRIRIAVEKAEKNTSGEIVVSVCKTTKKVDIYDEAKRIFGERKLYETKDRNGVLILLAYKDHKIAVLGDKGINEKTPDGYWDDVISHMINHFKKAEYTEGLERGVDMIGEKLKTFFPWAEGDINELKDEVNFED